MNYSDRSQELMFYLIEKSHRFVLSIGIFLDFLSRKSKDNFFLAFQLAFLKLKHTNVQMN